MPFNQSEPTSPPPFPTSIRPFPCSVFQHQGQQWQSGMVLAGWAWRVWFREIRASWVWAVWSSGSSSRDPCCLVSPSVRWAQGTYYVGSHLVSVPDLWERLVIYGSDLESLELQPFGDPAAV